MCWFWLGSKKRREVRQIDPDVLARVEKKEQDADIKVEIATVEVDKVNKLIDRARREDNKTLKLLLVIGGDKRMKR